MDASQEYAEMCSKSKEIQLLRGDELWQNGDFYQCITRNGLFQSWWTDTEDEPPQMFKPIWMPRQDQLQELMKEDESRIWRLHEWFSSWYPMGDKTDSFEKLWLVFVMNEKYCKGWDGIEWADMTPSQEGSSE